VRFDMLLSVHSREAFLTSYFTGWHGQCGWLAREFPLVEGIPERSRTAWLLPTGGGPLFKRER
jgi:hypothetical protein